MKKNLYIILAVALIAIAAIVWFVRSSGGGLDDSGFAYQDDEPITKVVLKERTGEEAILVKQENGDWLVNDKYIARRKAMQNMFKTIRDVKVNYPVSDQAHNNVIASFLKESVQVEIYTDKSEKPVRNYLVGLSTIDGQGTYMIMNNKGKMAKRAYVTYIPGFVGHLKQRFFTNEETWRTREVIRFPLDKLKSVKIEYPDDPEYGFTYTRNGEQGVLAPLNANYTLNKDIVAPRVNEFESYFESLSIEAFENKYPGRDSIVAQQPFCLLTIEDVEGTMFDMQIFYRPVDKRSKKQFYEDGTPLEHDLDRYFALINDEQDFVTIQHYVFGKIFRKYQDFFDLES